MKRKFIALIILSSVLLSGCSDSSLDFDTDRFECIKRIDEFDTTDMYIIRDKETGVNYILSYGYETSMMCPLYDSDGNVVVTNEKGE